MFIAFFNFGKEPVSSHKMYKLAFKCCCTNVHLILPLHLKTPQTNIDWDVSSKEMCCEHLM